MTFEDMKIQLIDVELVGKIPEAERTSLRTNPAMAHLRSLINLNGDNEQFRRKVLGLLSLACRNVLVLTKKKTGPQSQPPTEMIKGIQEQAEANGWTTDQLYGDGRTLQSVLQSTDTIDEVTSEFIRIKHDQGTTAKFYRHPPV